MFEANPLQFPKHKLEEMRVNAEAEIKQLKGFTEMQNYEIKDLTHHQINAQVTTAPGTSKSVPKGIRMQCKIKNPRKR